MDMHLSRWNACVAVEGSRGALDMETLGASISNYKYDKVAEYCVLR